MKVLYRERDKTFWERVFFAIANLSFFLALVSLSLKVLRTWQSLDHGARSDMTYVCLVFAALWATMLRERSSTLLFVIAALTFYAIRDIAVRLL
jgi:hypothetical protein